MLSGTSMNPRYLSLHDRCHSRGSLPLKKRRVNLEFSLFSSSSSPSAESQSLFKNIEDRTKLAYLPEHTVFRETGASSKTPLTLLAAAESLDKSEAEESTAELNSPRLDQPLPGGCHGKTSKTNSYCRRQAGFNGSNYCKLHYQQQQLQQQDKTRKKEPAKKSSSGSGVGTHQDKRYTGQPDEVRCLATTTRGRDCGYIAVNCSKYCFLHADYDTNPPPRRGGNGSSKSSDDHVLVSPSTVSSVSSSSTTVTAVPTPDKQAGNSKRRSSAKLKQMHAASPFPLLSMISTDQWYGKTVKIATGPFAGRLGDVEKWGNGWVNVRIPGVGLHNRRSFELYLKEEEKEEEEEEEVPRNLFRCVSRDARDVVSPSPSSDASTKSRRTLSLKIVGSDLEEGPHLLSPIPGTPRPGAFETPVSRDVCHPPEVTPFASVKPIAAPPKESTMESLQLPGVSSKNLPFAPSMDETRETVTSLKPADHDAISGLFQRKRGRAVYEDIE